MPQIDRDYTKYIDYLNNNYFEDRRMCEYIDIKLTAELKKYLPKIKTNDVLKLENDFRQGLITSLNLIFKDFNISLCDLYKEFKYTLPNFIYYLKIHNLNTVEDLRNRIIKLIDEKFVEEQEYVDYFNEHNKYIEFLLSIPEDFDFSEVIIELKNNEFAQKIFVDKNIRKSTTIFDAAIPRLRSILISMYSDVNFIDACCNRNYEKYYAKMYQKNTPERLKHEIFRSLIESYNKSCKEEIIDFELYDNYDIIDFFSEKLDVYMKA